MICCRCKENKELDLFPRDSRTISGRAGACKECKRIERSLKKDKELARWKRYYAPNTDNRRRHIIRSMTRRKLGPAKKLECSVCKTSQAQEWHHYAYKVDTAVPMCRPCHSNL